MKNKEKRSDPSKQRRKSGFKSLYFILFCVTLTVIISANTEVTQLNNGVFKGAGSVKELRIYKPEAETLNPPVDFSGTADGFIIRAPENSDYTTGYFWSQIKGITIKLDL